MPDLEGAKLAKNTFASPPRYWDDLRVVAAIRGTRPVAALREALDRYFATELPPDMRAALERKRAG